MLNQNVFSSMIVKGHVNIQEYLDLTTYRFYLNKCRLWYQLVQGVDNMTCAHWINCCPVDKCWHLLIMTALSTGWW